MTWYCCLTALLSIWSLLARKCDIAGIMIVAHQFRLVLDQQVKDTRCSVGLLMIQEAILTRTMFQVPSALVFCQFAIFLCFSFISHMPRSLQLSSTHRVFVLSIFALFSFFNSSFFHFCRGAETGWHHAGAR